MEEFITTLDEEKIKELELFKEEPNIVYVKLNDKNEVIEIGSSIFIKDTTGWIKISEGYGDKYAHAQSQYFDKPLKNDEGNYNYKFIEGQVIEVNK